MDFEDTLQRITIEYISKNGLKNVRTFDDLSTYHKAKVAVIVKRYKPEIFK